MKMIHCDVSAKRTGSSLALDTSKPIYTREAFRAILARQPEWKIRDALEDGNIPSPNIEHAIEWLEELASQQSGYWS
jgi:hypothetical protein